MMRALTSRTSPSMPIAKLNASRTSLNAIVALDDRAPVESEMLVPSTATIPLVR